MIGTCSYICELSFLFYSCLGHAECDKRKIELTTSCKSAKPSSFSFSLCFSASCLNSLLKALETCTSRFGALPRGWRFFLSAVVGIGDESASIFAFGDAGAADGVALHIVWMVSCLS